MRFGLRTVIWVGLIALTLAVPSPHSKEDQVEIGDQWNEESVLTNAERLAKGLSPAMPRGLKDLIASRTTMAGAGSEKRQAACPSMRPLAWPIAAEQAPFLNLMRNVYSDYTILPLNFNVTIGRQPRDDLYIGSSGFVQFDTGQGAAALPDGWPTQTLAHTAVAPYWDRILIDNTDRGQIIEYVNYKADDRSLLLRWNGRLYHSYQDQQQHIDFNLYYTIDTPGVWYIYYRLNDNGASGGAAAVAAWQDGRECFSQFYSGAGNVPLIFDMVGT
ncbi:uncharacterized protein I303_100574 [Kwoniella dejecticola CBS 10117]|uniref:Alginate lyase 2 domain-containing protein n=1 Tax=Kwoniella dejecticola CBS 10117 TaxID=1296121 RepID=A0A1A6AFD1_9TREE|nr:uncharacterized protein I303_00576 [Kwoniella dejecticola CBS 10117]OBR88759.1 hypothetical protein I303_00576 [Kwoniella dejecticola CBS 10117]